MSLSILLIAFVILVVPMCMPFIRNSLLKQQESAGECG